MTAPANRCAVCATPIKLGLLMCLDDWRNVPRELQREVNRTWRAYNAASNPGARLQCLAAYRAARSAAIDAAKAARP